MSAKQTTAKPKWILAKWVSCGIYITIEGRFFYPDGTELYKEWKEGACLRAKGSNVRHYYRKLNKQKVLINKRIEWGKN